MLGHVEAFDLVLLIDAQWHQEFDHLEQNETDDSRPDNDGKDRIELDQELARVTLDQSGKSGGVRACRYRRDCKNAGEKGTGCGGANTRIKMANSSQSGSMCSGLLYPWFRMSVSSVRVM